MKLASARAQLNLGPSNSGKARTQLSRARLRCAFWIAARLWMSGVEEGWEGRGGIGVEGGEGDCRVPTVSLWLCYQNTTVLLSSYSPRAFFSCFASFLWKYINGIE